MASEFRKDIVSGEWLLVAGGLKKKPNFFAAKKAKSAPKKNCPFENPQKTNNAPPLFWLPMTKAKGYEKEKIDSWFLQVITNKFPILAPHKTCPVPIYEGPYQKMGGVGFQEVVITRYHDRSLGFMKPEEIALVLEAYLERYIALKYEMCTEYILIFHNHGPSSGATVAHPHSQILALPIIPLDVSRSLFGSARYFHKNKKCVHCILLKKEFKGKKRIIFKNDLFVVIAPYASHVSFEMRIYPLRHNSNFEEISAEEKKSLSEIMHVVFAKIKNGMNNTDYNFFIHTAPTKAKDVNHYHWHMEILPRTSIWGGLELGSGTEVIKVPPEEAAGILRKVKYD